MCGFNDFVSDNSTFILTFFGLLGGACSGCLMCLLRSRCARISCGTGGLTIERNVLSEGAVTELTQSPTPPSVV